MTDEEKKAAEEKAAADDAAFNAKLNAAVSSHAKRLKAEFEKSLADAVAKLTPTKPDDKPADDKPAGGAKPDPEVARLREQVEKLTKQSADADAARAKAEQKAARDATHATLREQLDGLGIKGARARAVIADLESSGQLRLNEETGAYELAVKRPRSKGARPEELTYDDLGAGLKDWSQTDDAREFLPAQQAQQPQAGRKPLGAATLRTPASNNASPRAQADDLTRLLNANGVTEASLFGDD
jgi:hypothetical protein